MQGLFSCQLNTTRLLYIIIWVSVNSMLHWVVISCSCYTYTYWLIAHLWRSMHAIYWALSIYLKFALSIQNWCLCSPLKQSQYTCFLGYIVSVTFIVNSECCNIICLLSQSYLRFWTWNSAMDKHAKINNQYLWVIITCRTGTYFVNELYIYI